MTLIDNDGDDPTTDDENEDDHDNHNDDNDYHDDDDDDNKVCQIKKTRKWGFGVSSFGGPGYDSYDFPTRDSGDTLYT